MSFVFSANLAYSKTAIDPDISAIDVTSEILDQHADYMCHFFWLSEIASGNHLLVPK